MKKRLAAVALAITVTAFTGIATATAATVKVTSADVGESWFTGDTRPGGAATFENGPGATPYGTGSLELSTTVSTAKAQLLTDAYDGTPLADIDGIGYSTYRDPASTGFIAGLPALNLRVDLDANGTADAYMVYEPYQDHGNGAVLTGTWQTWDAYQDGDASWWFSNGAGGCGQSTPCTWSAILAAFPSATVREGTNFPIAPGSLGVNQGSGNAGFLTNVDGLYVSVSGEETIYDFDVPVGPPVSKDECKNGGWQSFDAPRVFKNQGDCVSFVANGR